MPGRRGGLSAAVFLLLFALLGLVPASAHAAIIDVALTGHVSFTNEALSVGKDLPVVGHWKYDTNALSQNEQYVDPTVSFAFTIGTGSNALPFSYTGAPAGVNRGIPGQPESFFRVLDWDFSGITGPVVGPEVGSWAPHAADLYFADSIGGGELPAMLQITRMVLTYWQPVTGGSQTTSVFVTFDRVEFPGSATPIPEPGSMGLVALGLAGLGAARRRR